MSVNILRNLYPEEHLYHNKLKDGDSIMCSTFIIETNFNLFSHFDQLKKALLHWINLHPCLGIQIDQNDPNSIPFFIKADENLVNELKNLMFLRYKPLNLEITEQKIWEPIHKNELETNVLLTYLPWRIVIVQISECKYSFTLNFHHAISDGSNMYYIIDELLDLIDKQIFSIIPKTTLERFKLSELEINNPNDPRNGGKLRKLQNYEGIFIPDALKYPQDEPENNMFNGLYELYDGSQIYDANFLFTKSLKSNTGMINIKIQESMFNNFIKVCKRNGVNLNGVYQLISCLAFRNVYKQYTGSCNETIKYDFTINTRPYLKNPIPNYVMNEYINEFSMKDLEWIEDGQDYWKFFWKNANQMHQNMICLIEKMKLENIHNPDWALEIIEQEKRGNRNGDVGAHFSFTNLGTKKSIDRSLKIKECYQGLSFMPNSFITLGHLYTCTIDSCAQWSFTYNRRLLKNSAAQNLMNFIENQIQKISNLQA